MALETRRLERIEITDGHPWIDLGQSDGLTEGLENGQSLALSDEADRFLGCGVVELGATGALWRRYTHADEVDFDETYIAGALVESIERRGEESCQRLVCSDADYLPGLVVDLFNDVALVRCETSAVAQQIDLVCEVLKEGLNPVEIVIAEGDDRRTASGQGLKGRWIEVDELVYRIDLLNSQKAGFFLDQREQHALVGSLCGGRSLLDAFSHSGAFAIQGIRAGAERAVAVDSNPDYVKAIGANAQRNDCPVETAQQDIAEFLETVDAGEFDAMVFDPPAGAFDADGWLDELHRAAFSLLPQSGLLATYCRSPLWSAEAFEGLVAGAAAHVGREARIFARTSQPFDFPMLLNFPESNALKGLILQVE